MPRVKTDLSTMDEIQDPKKRLICGILKQAIDDYRHPARSPQRALDASVFLLQDAQEMVGFCGLKVSQSHWENLIALL